MAADSEDTSSLDFSSSEEDDSDEWEEEGLDKYEEHQDSNNDYKSEKEDVDASKSSSRRARQKRKRKERGHRRNIKSKFDTIDDLNPEAISAQTEELERIRRLELQQSMLSHDVSRDSHTPATSTKSRTTSTGTTTYVKPGNIML